MSKRIFFAPYVCVCLYCIFAFSASKVPVLSILCPALIMLFGAFSLFKNSKITLYLGTAVVSVVTYLINDNLVFSLVYSLGYIAAGFMLCYTILRGKSGAYTLILTLICILISEYGAVAVSDLMTGKPPLSFVNEMFDALKPLMVDTLKQGLNGIDIANIEVIFDQYETLVRMVLPAMLIIIGLFETIILSFVVKIIVNKVITKTVVDLRFSMFKADGATIFVFLLSSLVSMFAGDSIIAVVFTNIYMITSVALLLCGMSLFDWYLKDVQKVKFIFRFLIFILVGISFVVPILPFVFIIAALIDSGRNFRLKGKDTSGK